MSIELNDIDAVFRKTRAAINSATLANKDIDIAENQLLKHRRRTHEANAHLGRLIKTFDTNLSVMGFTVHPIDGVRSEMDAWIDIVRSEMGFRYRALQSEIKNLTVPLSDQHVYAPYTRKREFESVLCVYLQRDSRLTGRTGKKIHMRRIYIDWAFRRTEREIKKTESAIKKLEYATTRAAKANDATIDAKVAYLVKKYRHIQLDGESCLVCFAKFDPTTIVVKSVCMHLYCADCLAAALVFAISRSDPDDPIKCPYCTRCPFNEVELVGDIARALLPYCDEIMHMLMQNLSNRDVKPQVLSVFGDIALSIGGEFRKYLEPVLEVLTQVMNIQVEQKDDYFCVLRESVLEAYTGIVQGLKGADTRPHQDIMLLQNHVPFIINYIVQTAQDPDLSETTMTSCAGLIGDLCAAFGAPLLPFLLEDNIVMPMLTEGKKSTTSRTKSTCSWALRAIKTLKQAQMKLRFINSPFDEDFYNNNIQFANNFPNAV